MSMTDQYIQDRYDYSIMQISTVDDAWDAEGQLDGRQGENRTKEIPANKIEKLYSKQGTKNVEIITGSR